MISIITKTVCRCWKNYFLKLLSSPKWASPCLLIFEIFVGPPFLLGSPSLLNFLKRKFTFNRSSHQRCSIKKGVLRNFTKFTGKHLCQSLFFNKVAGLHLFHRTPLVAASASSKFNWSFIPEYCSTEIVIVSTIFFVTYVMRCTIW